jgi:DNA-binding protein HU-beta
MTKADLIANISKRTGIERAITGAVIEAFMDEVKTNLLNGEDVHMRGFGSFLRKHRRQKTGRLLSKNTTIIIPAHDAPTFKPAEAFVEEMRTRSQQASPTS